MYDSLRRNNVGMGMVVMNRVWHLGTLCTEYCQAHLVPRLRALIFQASTTSTSQTHSDLFHSDLQRCLKFKVRRLRNLEVNSLKRFVGLAAMERPPQGLSVCGQRYISLSMWRPGPFSVGGDLKYLAFLLKSGLSEHGTSAKRSLSFLELP